MPTSRRIFVQTSAVLTCAALLGLLAVSTANAQYTSYWYDGFNTSATSLDINFENALRQGGAPAPISYVANPRPPTLQPADYHQQIAGPGPGTVLMLAGDGNAGLPFPDPSVGIAMASPVFNFSGLNGSDVIGRRITFSLDVAAVGGGPGGYIQAGINLGGNSTLTQGGTATPHFGVRFIEDTLSTPNYFLQLYDGTSLVGNLIANPAGAGFASVQLDINDLADGNPWDGVGSTTIDVFVNSALVGSYTKGGGGYTANFLTVEGSANFAGFGLATHLFDDLTVWAAPVPEPSVAVLLGLGLGGLLVARRRQRSGS